MRKLLVNNALDFIDKDIRDRYNLDLQVIGNVIYSVKRQEKQVKKKDGTIEIKKEIVEKKIMARVYALSTFYNDKGSLFDANFLKASGVLTKASFFACFNLNHGSSPY